MKRITAVIVAGVLALSLAGCVDHEAEKESAREWVTDSQVCQESGNEYFEWLPSGATETVYVCADAEEISKIKASVLDAAADPDLVPGRWNHVAFTREGSVGVLYLNGVEVARADGTTAVFTVTKVDRYPKDQFPSNAVYGAIDHAGLRLITCGGEFDTSRHSYHDNIVVYATLTHST